MSKHTPGPWRHLPPSSGINDNWHVTDAGDTFVAHVFGFAHSVDEQSRINARLIASAPELLDALRDVLRIAKAASIGVTGNAPRIARAKAAISKATGESA